jgi:hypothetical protein
LDGTFFNDSEEVIKEKIRAMAQFQAALREKSSHVFERLMNKEWDLTRLDAFQPNLARAQAFGLSWMVDERLWPLSDTDLEDHFNSKEVSAFQRWLTADFMLYYGSWLEGDWHKWSKKNSCRYQEETFRLTQIIAKGCFTTFYVDLFSRNKNIRE